MLPSSFGLPLEGFKFGRCNQILFVSGSVSVVSTEVGVDSVDSVDSGERYGVLFGNSQFFRHGSQDRVCRYTKWRLTAVVVLKNDTELPECW
jgi:hypothetical protein